MCKVSLIVKNPQKIITKLCKLPSGVGGDQNRDKRRVNIGLTVIRWIQTCSATCAKRQLCANMLVISTL